MPFRVWLRPTARSLPPRVEQVSSFPPLSPAADIQSAGLRLGSRPAREPVSRLRQDTTFCSGEAGAAGQMSPAGHERPQGDVYAEPGRLAPADIGRPGAKVAFVPNSDIGQTIRSPRWHALKTSPRSRDQAFWRSSG